MKMTYIRLFLPVMAAAAALLAVSCGREDIKVDVPEKDGILICTPCVEEMTTKSRISSAEDKLSEASVAVYDATGTFIRSVYKTDMNAIEFPRLHIGETYHVYAAFNMGDLSFPARESDITSLTHSWDVSGINSKGLPMVWSGTVDMTSATQNVPMQAVRLVSKIRFSCNDSGLDDHKGSFSVSSVTLKNAAKTVSVFADKQSLRGEDYSSDSATAADVTSLNAGGKVSFYTFENLCGTLLPGNTDPWKKVPDNIGGNAAKCTYLEVTGTYSTDGGTASAPVTYRMYLGENSTTNFDLLRNYIYDVTLCPSDEGIGLTSWKITRGSFTDTRSLRFRPDTVAIDLGGSATFKVIPTPSDMKYTVKGGEGFESSTLTLAATGNANEYSLVSSGSLSTDVYTSVVATSWDGRVSDSFLITVKAKLLKSIAITPATVYKSTGETQAYIVTATYDEGGTDVREDVTAQATYTSSKTDVAEMGTGGNRHIATAKNGGTSTITASFGGKTATAQFNTRYPVALKVSCPDYQSGTETAPVWKIDWHYVLKADKSQVPYTVTVVYDDGTEAVDMQASCTATQTYRTGTAGEGNCFVFDKGTITQAISGDKDTGGYGTVTFSYTEAGKTADIDVQWWKLYFEKLKLSRENIMCNIKATTSTSGVEDLVLDETIGYDLSVDKVVGTYNDNSTKEVGKYSDSDIFGSTNLDYLSGVGTCIKFGYGYMTVIPLRKGTVSIKSKTTYRGLYVSQDIKIWAAGAISTSESSFVYPQKFAPGDTYYAAYVDADGGHVCTGEGVRDIGFYRGAGLYYASDLQPEGNGRYIKAQTIVDRLGRGILHDGSGTMNFYCWNEYTYRETNGSGEYAGKFAEYPKAGADLNPRVMGIRIDPADWPE